MAKAKEKCFKCEIPIISSRMSKTNKITKIKKAFVGGSWSDNDEDEEEKTNDEKCLMAKASNEKAPTQKSGPYCTDLPTPDDIRRLLELERVMQWEELIRENVFGLRGQRDRLPACLAHMLYCVVADEQYNLAYFFVKRIECARATPTANIPIYDIVERVMRPLALKQTQRPRSDRGKARHSISSSSSHHQGTSSHQHDDNDDDVETSRASTPSPTTYLNSLNPLNYQNYQMPSSFEQTDETLFERQTTLLNQTQQMHKEMRGGSESMKEHKSRCLARRRSEDIRNENS
ncbi:hypothetical protein Tco_1192008 [Tanacetum coccineum]